MTAQRHQPGACFCGSCMTCARLNAPTLYGFLGKESRSTFTQVYAWCPHCANWHRHGDASNKPGDVLHRYPHCIQGGPHKETGYLITVTNTPLSDVWKRMRRTTFEQGLVIGDGRTTPAIERLRRQPLPMLRPEHHGGRIV